jgi:hypothetical protein
VATISYFSISKVRGIAWFPTQFFHSRYYSHVISFSVIAAICDLNHSRSKLWKSLHSYWKHLNLHEGLYLKCHFLHFYVSLILPRTFYTTFLSTSFTLSLPKSPISDW